MIQCEGVGDERHFAGVTTSFVIEYLRTQMPDTAIDALLRRAEETRTAAELADDSTWSSYAQLRRFLEATVDSLENGASLRNVGTKTIAVLPEFTTMLQGLGSPAALYRDLGELSAHFSPIVAVATREITSTEWVCEMRFKEPFEPFRAYCDYVCGLLGIVPRVFSFPLAEAVEEACQLDGAPCCRFRVRWNAEDDAERRADHLQLQLDLVNARLATLHATVAELVSDEGLEQVLGRILASAAKAVNAPAYILALENLPTASQHVYAEGLNDQDARRLAHEVLHDTEMNDPGRLIVDVTSTRRRYGRLAALQHRGASFFAQERSSLEVYARLAAAALDSAAALEDARRQAATARTLLTLSSALAEIVSIDEVAARLVRSVPEIIECDRAVVVLVHPDTSIAHVAATYGYQDEDDSALRAARFPIGRARDSNSLVASIDASPMPFDLKESSKQFGSVSATSCPIVSNGELIGWLGASVTHGSAQLERDPEIRARLRGLTGQAATAIRNARLVEEARHKSLHDSLTGLPNRALVLDRVEQLLARTRRHHTTASVLFVDLDGFKEVNDTFGHAAGDELLRLVAARLETTLRRSDTIGRLGGDEFVVLTESDTVSAQPELAADRILATLREPFRIAASTVRITASVGIAMGDRAEAAELLRDADIALYRAKADGKDRYASYVPEMHEAVRDHIQLDIDLRGALALGEYLLVYQPICNLETGAVTGVEALLRWQHPTRGVVQPDMFISALEDNGLIIDVGRWVLETACWQAAEWRSRGFMLQMSVNVSGKQLEHERFLDDVRDALRDSELDPSALILEITETVALHDLKTSCERLGRLKQLGVRIAIDDFGTGYSSLAHLREFPVDTLKIDRSFVAGLDKSSEADALMHMLVSLGKSLGLETVAEGIEIHEQYAHLQREACDSGQGFLIARPLEAEGLEPFLMIAFPSASAARETA